MQKYGGEKCKNRSILNEMYIFVLNVIVLLNGQFLRIHTFRVDYKNKNEWSGDSVILVGVNFLIRTSTTFAVCLIMT